MKTFVCQNCNKEFSVPTNRAQVRKHCSAKCRGESYKKKKPLVNCLHCGEKINRRNGSTNKFYCSRDHQLKQEFIDKYNKVEPDLHRFSKGEVSITEVRIKHNLFHKTLDKYFNKFLKKDYEKRKEVIIVTIQDSVPPEGEVWREPLEYKLEDVINEYNSHFI